MNIIVIFKESLVISTLINIVNGFVRAYKNSALKRNVDKFVICFKNSRTCNILSKYANKKAYYRYSIVYKIIMAIAKLFDKLFGNINKLAKAWFRGSKSADTVVKAVKAQINFKLYGFGLLFMSIPIGSIIAQIILESTSALNMIICWVVFIFGLILVVMACCRDAVKGSLVIRYVAKFIELIR